MQFRFNNDAVEVLRLEMEPRTGAQRRLLLGTMKLSDLRPSDDLVANCAQEEIAEIQEWIKQRRISLSDRHELAARQLPDTIRETALLLESAEPDAAMQSLADDIRTNWALLSQVLEERGLI